MAPAVHSRIDSIDAGATVAFQPSLWLSSGAHAVALRTTSPSEPSQGAWDIEFMDPNANGYRFSDKEQFFSCIPRFYGQRYPKVWLVLALASVHVSRDREISDAATTKMKLARQQLRDNGELASDCARGHRGARP